MSINAILLTGLSALQTSQSALGTTSGNISNVNTAGYQRRTTILSPAVAGGQLAGVEVAEIKRISDTYFAQQTRGASALAAQAQAQADMHDRVQMLLGNPTDNTSIASQITSTSSAFASLALDPSSSVSRSTALAELEETAHQFETLSDSLQQLRADTDTQISGDIEEINRLIKQINDLNPLIKQQVISGNEATGLLDQREMAITELSQYMDISVSEQAYGGVHVSTPSGLALVSDASYAQLEYTPVSTAASSTIFPEIAVQRINSATGDAIGIPTTLEPHLSGGELKGLLDMRNNDLKAAAEELGALAGAYADALNAAHADSTAYPPVQTLTGRNTGLADTDALNFSGETTLAIVDEDGALVRRVDIDFDAGTLSVDGGAATPIGGTTIGDLETALNTALSGVATVDFSGGVMEVSATSSTNGVAFLQSASDPSDRGGRGFAHFFGLNDLITTGGTMVPETGLSGTDDHGFAAGGQIEFMLRGPDGDVALNATVTVGGTSVNDLLTSLNTAFSGYGTFGVDGDGQLSISPSSGYAGYDLEVVSDTTNRASTGVSMSSFFGLGSQQICGQSENWSIRSDISDDPSHLSLAKLDISATTAVGDTVVAESDNRGALALQEAENTEFDFSDAGNLAAMTASIGEYAATFLSDLGQRAELAEATAEDLTALKDEVMERRSAIEGVNLDEELAAMIVYQQSYNAAARIMTTAQDLYDALLSLVN
ncbi:MAG: flagellar hook-associated protein FlgK [Alphaproteobacteria bacterium]|nr:flagellar hook-associated protein FlgK [Alphaproteobacteria bacterium]